MPRRKSISSDQLIAENIRVLRCPAQVDPDSVGVLNAPDQDGGMIDRLQDDEQLAQAARNRKIYDLQQALYAVNPGMPPEERARLLRLPL